MFSILCKNKLCGSSDVFLAIPAVSLKVQCWVTNGIKLVVKVSVLSLLVALQEVCQQWNCLVLNQ